jgi:voltage-gated potassium channel Kch
MKTLQPQEDEVKELRNHVIIAGYGRVGQIIAQMLSELLIPFVALDVRSDRWETSYSPQGSFIHSVWRALQPDGGCAHQRHVSA